MAEGYTLGDVLGIVSAAADDQGLKFTDMFGSAEAAKAGLILLGNSVSDVENGLVEAGGSTSQFNEMLAGIQAGAGGTESALEKLETKNRKAQVAFNLVKNAALDFGQVASGMLAPYVEQFAGVIEKATDKLKNMDEGQKKAVITFAAVVAAAGPVLSVAGKGISIVVYMNSTPFVLDIATADGSLNRYDSLMLRLNLSINEVYAIIVQGAYATTPQTPACTRNAETFDLKICDIYVPAGCTKITQDQITDTRLDSSVCGVPVFPVEHLDMTSFYRQISADLLKFREDEEAGFAAWVAEQEDTNMATMTDLVEAVRDTSDESRAEILALLQQLNTLVDSDTVGTLIAQINNAVKKSGDTMTGDLNMGGHAIIGAELTQIVQATLTAAGWSASAPYTQTVAVAGVTAGKSPYITPVYSGVADADIVLREACAAVSYAKPGSGTITFVCLEDKPQTNIPVQVEVKR